MGGIFNFAAAFAAGTAVAKRVGAGMVDLSVVTFAVIIGVGATRRLSAVRWGVARRILWAWVLTIPAAGCVGGGIYFVMHWSAGGRKPSARPSARATVLRTSCTLTFWDRADASPVKGLCGQSPNRGGFTIVKGVTSARSERPRGVGRRGWKWNELVVPDEGSR